MFFWGSIFQQFKHNGGPGQIGDAILRRISGVDIPDDIVQQFRCFPDDTAVSADRRELPESGHIHTGTTSDDPMYPGGKNTIADRFNTMLLAGRNDHQCPSGDHQIIFATPFQHSGGTVSGGTSGNMQITQHHTGQLPPPGRISRRCLRIIGRQCFQKNIFNRIIHIFNHSVHIIFQHSNYII